MVIVSVIVIMLGLVLLMVMEKPMDEEWNFACKLGWYDGFQALGFRDLELPLL